jgi:ferric-chelate reductase
VLRECSAIQITPATWLHIPPVGTVWLILSYFGLIAALEFIDNDYPGAQHFQAYGIRAAWLAVAQVPLIVLLAGKSNLIGYLTSLNYQRLNVLHRWVARGLLVLATMHFALQMRGWSQFGLVQMEWSTDTCPPTGIAAYAILLWMNVVNLAPTRRISYHFFVVQHVLMFVGFIVALMIHLPSTALYSRVYIWIGMGLYAFDRLVRTLWTIWQNRLGSKAHLEDLDGVATRVTITNKTIKRWSAGSHVLLSIPRFSYLQTHPATIVSTPTSHDGDLVFILKGHRGFTRSLIRSAGSTHRCLIDGPYASSQLGLTAFEVVSLVAGGTGVTFALANLLALADRAAAGPKKVDFTWTIRSQAHIAWIERELVRAIKALQDGGVDVVCTIYVTRECNVAACGKGCGQRKTECCCKTKGCVDEKAVTAEGEPWKVQYGRPQLGAVLLSSVEKASDGETAIVACGPLAMTKTIRNQYARICDERAACRCPGSNGVYLHVENSYN